MRRVLIWLAALAIGSSANAQNSTNDSPYSAAVILPGRIESCAVNPPLSLVTKGNSAAEKNGDYILSSATRTAVLVAYSGREATTGGPITLVLDELTVSSLGAASKTGETRKVFEQRASPAETRLVAKSGDYSVCKFKAPVSGEVSSIVETRAVPVSFRSDVSEAARAIWDLFGLGPDSYVRLRLNSIPSGADILVGKLRQSAQTNTVLDVLGVEIPNVRLEKPGFEACSYKQWATSFEQGSKRILNATCHLRPKRAIKRKP